MTIKEVLKVLAPEAKRSRKPRAKDHRKEKSRGSSGAGPETKRKNSERRSPGKARPIGQQGSEQSPMARPANGKSRRTKGSKRPKAAED